MWQRTLKAIRMLKKIIKKRKLWILLIVITLLFGSLGGFLSGWFMSKEHLGSFTSIDNKTRLLVIAPHPDDEVLITGGLIQKVLSAGGLVRIVYLTSGDGNKVSVIRLDKTIKLTSTEYLNLGEKRKNEALGAMRVLGLIERDLIFLGFPDGELDQVLTRNTSDSKVAVQSKTTKADAVPYLWAYKPNQKYFADEIENDIKEIVGNFKPTLVVTTNINDKHPDHKAAYELVDKISNETNANWLFYSAIVHYNDYPEKGNSLVPPKKLFNNRWESLVISDIERQKKREALLKYKSQVARGEEWWYMGFVAKNEIFEQE